MNYRGTIAYRAGLGGNVPEGFLASAVGAWDFMTHEHLRTCEDPTGTGCPRVHFMRGLSCMLHDSANQIADGFLGDWVLMLDTDHVFASDAFYEMVQTFEGNNGANMPLDILTGFAQKRQPPYTPLLYKTDFDPLKPFENIIPEGALRHTLVPIDASGCACLMVRRRVFDAIKNAGERPFDMRRKFNNFHLKTHEPLNLVSLSGVHPFEGTGYVRLPADRHIDEVFWEDVSFFWRAHMLGFKAFAAPWIKFHHIETRLVTDDLIQRPKPSEIPE